MLTRLLGLNARKTFVGKYANNFLASRGRDIAFSKGLSIRRPLTTTSSFNKQSTYLIKGLKLFAFVNLTLFTVFEAVVYYKYNRFATMQDMHDLIAMANGNQVKLNKLEKDIDEIQKEGSGLEAESEMLRVKMDDERLALLNKWDDIFEELKLPDIPFLKKSDVVALEKKLSELHAEMDVFKDKVGIHEHEVDHLNTYFNKLNSPNKYIQCHIDDLKERIKSIMSTIESTHKSPQIDAFLKAVREGPFLEEDEKIQISNDIESDNNSPSLNNKSDDDNNNNESNNKSDNNNNEPPPVIQTNIETIIIENNPLLDTNEESNDNGPTIFSEDKVDIDTKISNINANKENALEMKELIKSMSEGFYNATNQKLATQKQELEALHELNMEKQRNLIQMAFTDKYASVIDQIKLIIGRTTRVHRLLIDTINLSAVNSLLAKADHYLEDSDTHVYPRGYLAYLLFETLKRSDSSYGFVIGVIADTIPTEVLIDGADNQYSLIKRFHALKKDAEQLAYLETKEMNLWNFFVSYLHSMTHSSSNLRLFDVIPFQHYNYCIDDNEVSGTQEQSPFEVYCLLDKANESIVDGNLYNAACYVSHIKNYSGHTMKEWLHDVHNYLAAHQAISLLKAYASNNQIVPINENSKQRVV